MSYQIQFSHVMRLMGLVALCSIGIPQIVEAQQPTTLRRDSGGWQPTTQQPTKQQIVQPAAQPVLRTAPAQVQTAYFQAQGSLSDGLPVLPVAGQGLPAGASAPPAFPGVGGMPASSAPQFVSPPVVPPENMAPPQLPMANRANEGGYPSGGQQFPARNQNNQQSSDDYQNYGNQAPGYQPQSLPPSNYAGTNSQASAAGGGVPARLASGELRTIQNGRLPSRDDGSNSMVGGGSEQGPAGNNGRPGAEGFTTGLPFVTSAPRGRYPTSPYQPAVFQSADYRPLAVPAQFASSTTSVPQAYVAPPPTSTTYPTATQPASLPQMAGAAPPAYLTAQQAPLPQYRYPQPGIYATAYQCTAPGPSVPSTGAVPGGYLPPTLPPNLTPNLYTPNNSGYTPFFSLGQENYNVQLGRGIIGQPTVYVPGQPIRNFMRYISP